MTLTFNREAYGALLAQYQPKVITTEDENEQALILAQELEHRDHRTPEEEIFLELLVTLIEKFEADYYPIPDSSPQKILQHLLQENNLKPEDVSTILGVPNLISDILDGKQTINPAQAKKLAEFFKVDVSLFLVDRSGTHATI